MNQILLTEKMAMKCKKKIAKKQAKREARISRMEKIKNAVKFLFSKKQIDMSFVKTKLSKFHIKHSYNKKTSKTVTQKKIVFKPMNQILISGEKALVPIKAKENLIYKVGLVFSLICALTFGGLSAYATYDRNKNEEISKEILASIELGNVVGNTESEEQKEEKITSERIKLSEDMVIVILNKEVAEPKINIESLASEEKTEKEEKKFIEVNLAENGETYYIIATISIPKINVNYPILSETSDTLLEISPCKYWGGEVNTVGNLCIMGHNYVNTQFFSKVPSLKKGDIIEITDIEGNMMEYSVYDKYEIADDDMSCTSQLTDGNIDLTLITCTNNGKKRVVVKARVIE